MHSCPGKMTEALLHPLAIGGVSLPCNIALAPMAGVTDSPFRRICRGMGAGFVSGEMISAKALVYRNKNTAALCLIHPEEHPVSLQLFGNDPEIMAQAAAILAEEYPHDVLDINMGCPVPKVVKNGEGSALMRDPALIGRIVEAVVRTAARPVTVKLRKGFGRDECSAPECALAAEAGGAAAVTIHGRTREQYYSGSADWEAIRLVKEALHIPVFANGDVTDAASCAKILAVTGCDGVMIGRAAEGDPWIFREVTAGLSGAAVPPRPDRNELREMILTHARLLTEDKGEFTAMREMRKHAAWYLRGLPGAARMRVRLSAMEHFEELETMLQLL